MAGWLDWLIAPCLFGHSRDWHSGPWRDGRRPKLCDRCLQPIGWQCEGEMKATPLAQVVAGHPRGKAKRVTRPNVVTPMRRER